jgi:hypothetical protein
MFTFREPRAVTFGAVFGLLVLGAGPSLAQPRPYFQGLSPAQQLAYYQGTFANTRAFGGSFLSPYAGYPITPFMAGAPFYSPPLYAAPTINPYANPYLNPYLASSALAAPGLAGNPYTATITSTGTLPTNLGYDTGAAAYNNAYTNPYGYGGYGESPIGGYMRGYADVISSVTKGMIDEQQARLVKTHVKREELENQRRAFDNWLYYREKTPTAEDDRQRYLQMQVRRALNDPPVGEVYSGVALNTILDDLGKRLGKDTAAQGPALPLDDDVVRHLNFTGQENRGNPGLLKNEGRLSWPLVLRGAPYKAERDMLNDLTPTVYEQAVAGRVDPGALETMAGAVRRLQERLTENIRDLTPNQYSDGRRFLGDFEDALSLLRQPNAGDYFGQKAPKARNIADLVQQMLGRGLRFAPATVGDESAYVAAHRALSVYASNASAQVATDKAPEKATEKEKEK